MFKGHEIRTDTTIIPGKVCWCVSDVGKALNYAQAKDAIQLVPKERRHKITIVAMRQHGSDQRAFGPPTNLVFTDTDSVIRLVYKSEAEGAEEFRQWLDRAGAHILQHGYYAEPGVVPTTAPQPALDPALTTAMLAMAESAKMMAAAVSIIGARLDSIERRLDERPIPTPAPAPPATLPPLPAAPLLPLKNGAAVRSKDPFEVKLAAVRAKVAKAPESFTVSVVNPGLLTPVDVFEALAVMAAAGEIEREPERQGRGRPAPRYRKLAPIAPTAAPPVTTPTTVAPPSPEPPSSPPLPTPTPELANRLESLERKIDELRVASLPVVDPVAAAAAEEHRRNVSEKRREAGRLGAATTNAKRWGVPQTEEEAELKRRAISEARREAGRKGGLANAAKVAAERGARRGEGGRFAPATALHGVAPFDKAKANQVVAAIKEGFDRQEARELAGVSTEVFESWLTRGLSTDYTEDDFEYRLFYLQVIQAETKRAEKQRVLDEDRRRALGLIYQLRQPFYRADLGRALWPGGEWSAEQIDPIISWLEAEGMICSMPGRTRAGWSSTKWRASGWHNGTGPADLSAGPS